MNKSPQHLAAFRMLDESGIWKSNYAPPIFRLLWRIGVNVPPPHFMSFVGSAALTGGTFGTLWGVFMLIFSAAIGHMNFPVLWTTSVLAGIVFGTSMAIYYALGRKQHKFPKWSSLLEVRGDA